MTRPDGFRQRDDPQRRARAHLFAAGASAVIAIGAFPLFGWPASVGMVLVAVGNLLAGRGMRADGEVGSTAWALIAVGAVAFVVSVVLAVLAAASR